MSAAAYQGLLGSLACAFRSVQEPDCARLLGPVVPGATMTQGARVPGTSFELEPAVAAFNLGAMMGSVALAALLPVADYLARKAHNEARSPLKVQDVLLAMQEARQSAHPFDGATLAMTQWLGGSRAQLAAALALDPRSPEERPASRIACGDAAARAVRRAFLALKLEPGAAVEECSPHPLPVRQEAQDGATGNDEFSASVRSLFPARQAAMICARLGNPAEVIDMGVHEFIALLVRNA